MKGVSADRKEKNNPRTEPEILWRLPYKKKVNCRGRGTETFSANIRKEWPAREEENQERVVFWKPWEENISSGNE